LLPPALKFTEVAAADRYSATLRQQLH
jgi:hypothetical protein